MSSFSHCDSSNQPLDFKLDAIFQKEGGFFIELGANDGLRQSNTAFFELSRGWKGILIEPSVNKYEECIKNRPGSIVLNYACVSNDYVHDFVEGDFNGQLMSSVNATRIVLEECKSPIVKVNATTLEKVLDGHLSQGKIIDFLSLDAEGYELNILKGLNLSKYTPKYMLIEIYSWDLDAITSFLGEHGYMLHSNFSNYNPNDNPGWDGTHNDYLFILRGDPVSPLASL
jgi:FkbM family methyltransferase